MPINKKHEDGRWLYTVSGRLDVNTSPDLQKDLEENITGSEDVVFDFSELKFISSAGLRVLVFTKKKLGENGTVIIQGANEFVLEILETTGLRSVFDIR
jgi:anti-sigma B factor antagonist